MRFSSSPRPLLALLAAALVLLVAAASLGATAQPTSTYAGAMLRGSQLAPNAIGYVLFLQPDGPNTNTTVVAAITGLPRGRSFAMHVHTYGDLSSGIGKKNISTTTAGVGGHFNPLNTAHGCGYGNLRHVGDVGNFTTSLTATDADTAIFVSELIDLSYSNRSVIGRAVVLHTAGDTCGQPTGNAGMPLMHGVIGVINPNNSALTAFLDGAGWTKPTVNRATLPLIASSSTTPDITYGQPASAVAYLYPPYTTTSNVNAFTQAVGVVRFVFDSTTSLVNVSAYITNLTAGATLGFHVHAFGDDSDSFKNTSSTVSPFLMASGHFNPFNGAHAYPPSPTRHAGDMGNITADANGVVQFTSQFDLLDLVNGNSTIIGRSVVVHVQRDDGTGATGNAGARLLCGIIGISGQNTPVWNVDFTPFDVPTPGTAAFSSSTGISALSSTGSSTSDASPSTSAAMSSMMMLVATSLSVILTSLLALAL